MDGKNKDSVDAERTKQLEAKLARLRAEQTRLEAIERNELKESPKPLTARHSVVDESGEWRSCLGSSLCIAAILGVIFFSSKNPDLFSNRWNEPFVRGLRESRAKQELAYPGITSNRPDRVKRALGTLKSQLPLSADGKSVQSLRFFFGPFSKYPSDPPGFKLVTGSGRLIKTFINEDIYKLEKGIGDQVFGHCILISGRAINVPRIEKGTQQYSEDSLLIVNGKQVPITYTVSLSGDISGAPYNHFSITSRDLPLRTK